MDGWLREVLEAATDSRSLLAVHPPVACTLEVYQLLTQMLAAVQTRQVIVAAGQNDADLSTWADYAGRTLRQHRAAAVSRGEQHA